MPSSNLNLDKIKVKGTLGLIPGASVTFITKTNTYIDEYFKCSKREDKIAALKKIQEAIYEAELYSPSKGTHGELEFHEVKRSLFRQIKAAYAQNGVDSMAENGHLPDSISSILVNMDPEKADTLMLMLIEPEFVQIKLNSLYDAKDECAEAKNWKSFMQSHAIKFLGGGNSRNFKVTKIADGSTQVLKVDNRLGSPRYVQQLLRKKIPDIFTPIYAERQVMWMPEDDNDFELEVEGVSRGLLVTDFCNRGNLMDCSTLSLKKSGIERYSETCVIMGQMANIFMAIQNAKCIFPDAKLTNWLIDKNTVRLADTKSLMINGDDNFRMLHTRGLLPTEFATSLKPENPEELHVFLLGINIHAYLTGSQHGIPWLFTAPIFQTPLGQRYQGLIEKLIKDPSSERMRLADAQIKLAELELITKCITKYIKEGKSQSLIESIMQSMPDNCESPEEYLKKKLSSLPLEYLELRQQIEAFKIGDADKQMTLYLNECDKNMLLEVGKNPLESVLIQSMEETKKGLGHPLNQKIKDILDGFQSKNKWNRDKKSQKITQAMSGIPIKIRATMIEKSIDDKDLAPLLKALSWNRLSLFGSTNSFKEFKATYQARKTAANLAQKTEADPESKDNETNITVLGKNSP